jgi:hypothetical protein
LRTYLFGRRVEGVLYSQASHIPLLEIIACSFRVAMLSRFGTRKRLIP